MDIPAPDITAASMVRIAHVVQCVDVKLVFKDLRENEVCHKIAAAVCKTQHAT